MLHALARQTRVKPGLHVDGAQAVLVEEGDQRARQASERRHERVGQHRAGDRGRDEGLVGAAGVAELAGERRGDPARLIVARTRGVRCGGAAAVDQRDHVLVLEASIWVGLLVTHDVPGHPRQRADDVDALHEAGVRHQHVDRDPSGAGLQRLGQRRHIDHGLRD